MTNGKTFGIFKYYTLMCARSGVIHRSLMLSSQPVTGKWKIIVSTLPAQVNHFILSLFYKD